MNKPLKTIVLVGTRPEIIKMQPIIKEIEKRNEFELCFVHTGQHYDWYMAGSFIQELQLPQPKYFLNIGSGSHGKQTARIIARFEPLLKKYEPDIVLVEGDTNSALGGALAAAKLNFPVVHIEAGCRSFDRTMPEEINRIVIDDLAFVHCAPTNTCFKNLLNEGISQKSIFLTGHPIVDVLHTMKSKMRASSILSKFGVKSREFYFVTVHRDKNVDRKDNLMSIIKALKQISQERSVIFSVHPRTMKRIKQFHLIDLLDSVKLVEPLSLTSTLTLIKQARLVLTDSGGIQQEALLLGTPCITLRDTTEWVETVELGVNFLAGNNTERIVSTVQSVENNLTTVQDRLAKAKNVNVYGNLGVANRILSILMENADLFRKSRR
ncbi:MAG: UDP-N-acetylglucosamine 2-epimerase (non-hydrolyzing) [Candidatus Brockarchaeota archaeon]|nr:UDP-N-acetylglucosamine 2-epimerase (non-hydrolyzing) [Candidatus Brockarchaeota archaeon]